MKIAAAPCMIGLAILVGLLAGCESSDSKTPPAGAAKNSEPAFNLDALPVEPITVEAFFKEKALAKSIGKRVTFECTIEKVNQYFENPPGFEATGFPVEFEGLKEPVEDKSNLAEYSRKYNEYAKKEIRRVGETVTFSFNDRPSYDKLKDAKGKRATISGVVAASPIEGSVDLNHCRVMSIKD